jgi:hypothetical protein
LLCSTRDEASHRAAESKWPKSLPQEFWGSSSTLHTACKETAHRLGKWVNREIKARRQILQDQSKSLDDYKREIKDGEKVMYDIVSRIMRVAEEEIEAGLERSFKEPTEGSVTAKTSTPSTVADTPSSLHTVDETPSYPKSARKVAIEESLEPTPVVLSGLSGNSLELRRRLRIRSQIFFPDADGEKNPKQFQLIEQILNVVPAVAVLTLKRQNTMYRIRQRLIKLYHSNKRDVYVRLPQVLEIALHANQALDTPLLSREEEEALRKISNELIYLEDFDTFTRELRKLPILWQPESLEEENEDVNEASQAGGTSSENPRTTKKENVNSHENNQVIENEDDDVDESYNDDVEHGINEVSEAGGVSSENPRTTRKENLNSHDNDHVIEYYDEDVDDVHNDDIEFWISEVSQTGGFNPKDPRMTLVRKEDVITEYDDDADPWIKSILRDDSTLQPDVSSMTGTFDPPPTTTTTPSSKPNTHTPDADQYGSGNHSLFPNRKKGTTMKHASIGPRLMKKNSSHTEDEHDLSKAPKTTSHDHNPPVRKINNPVSKIATVDVVRVN